MSDVPLVSIAVASLRTGTSLIRLLNSIRDATTVDYEVVVATPKTNSGIRAQIERDYPARFVFEDEPRGCVSAYNLSFFASRGKFVCHINDDCVYLPGAIDRMVEALGDKDVIGAFAFQEEPYTQGSFVTRTYRGKIYANFSCAKRTILVDKLHGWDAEHFLHYSADPDVCLRAWQMGIPTIPVMDARVIHYLEQDDVRKEHLRERDSEALSTKWENVVLNG